MSSEWLMLSKHSHLLYNFECDRKHRLSAMNCIFLGEAKVVDAKHWDKTLLIKSQKQVEGHFYVLLYFYEQAHEQKLNSSLKKKERWNT